MQTVDLTHDIRSGMPVYPGDPDVRVESTATVAAEGYRTSLLELPSHAGTHVDAPSHLLADGRSIDDYPPEAFRFAAAVADVRPLEPRDAIGVDALVDAAKGTGGDALADVDLVVVRTGWDERWGTDRYFDHPYLTAEAAEWVVDRGCHLGVDTPNPDPTPTGAAGDGEPDGYPAHRALFDAEKLILENVRGLEAVPERADVRAYPLPVADGDASPVRAVAEFD